MSIPNRFRLSTNATEKLRQLKGNTGLTPNILARCAIMLAIKESKGINNASVPDNDGLELNKSVLFGDLVDYYELFINQYKNEHDITVTSQKLVVALIEIGVHKLGHVKKLDELNTILT